MSSSGTTVSSTAGNYPDSSVESGHIAAIIVGILVGLTILCYAVYRIAQRYCPNLLLAITPQDNARPLARAAHSQQSDYDSRAAEMAAHMAAADRKSAHSDKKADSHAIDMPAVASPLSVNEQWTVRDAPAEDEDIQ